MIQISLCMIVRDEADTITRCLESVKDLVDEIIIVDTGSCDQTKKRAHAFTALIFDYEWNDDFAAARNFSFAKATMDYIIWLDADDVILPEDQVKFQELKASLTPDVDMVMMRYNSALDGAGRPTLSYFRERLFKRRPDLHWNDPVHEYIQPAGNIIQAEISITHMKLHFRSSDRNLRIYQKRIERGEPLSARARLYFGMELYYHNQFTEAIPEFERFLDFEQGWVEDNIKASYYLGKAYIGIDEFNSAFGALLRSFQYDLPRAEICCEIGYIYKARFDLGKAIFWFELATRLKAPDQGWGFIYHDYWGFIPALELCVCYYQIGKTDRSREWNERAAVFKPNDRSIVYNRAFFDSLPEH